MKTITCILSAAGIFAFSSMVFATDCPMGYEKKGKSYHKGMEHAPGLSGYKVRFNEIDKDGNGALNREEYKAHFPDAEDKVFDALDTDKDGAVSREEWHSFKAAHGMAGPHAGQGSGKYHQKVLPDPDPYNVHFPDIDKNGDDTVSMDEFKAHFPEGDEKVFEAVDLDKNGSLTHEEWHEFKSAHGMKHQDK